jgi:hypothetical protein
MKSHRSLLALGVLALAFASSARALTLAQFIDCIGPNTGNYGTYDSGTGITTCSLDTNASPYALPTSGAGSIGLEIQRSNLLVTGGSTNPGDTVLQRSLLSQEWMMYADAGVTDVTIEYLTFDGNRYGISGLNCNVGFQDLELNNADGSHANGVFTVQYVNFINGPDISLDMNGIVEGGVRASTVSYSNFGVMTDHSKANRATSIWLAGNYSGAYYNNVYYAGTAAINLLGYAQVAYNNTLYSSRYEQGDSGGALYIGDGTTYATVAANIIDGNNWQITTGQYINGCYHAAGATLSGIEGYGSGHRYFDNEVFNHTGDAVNLQGTSGTWSGLLIAGNNPFNSSDTVRYIHNNAYDGVRLKGGSGNGTTSGVEFDGVNIAGNGAYAIEIYSGGVVATSTGFTSGSTTHICNNHGSSSWVNMFYLGSGSTLTNTTPSTNVTSSCAYTYP